MSIKPYLLIFCLIIQVTVLTLKVEATEQEITQNEVGDFF